MSTFLGDARDDGGCTTTSLTTLRVLVETGPDVVARGGTAGLVIAVGGFEAGVLEGCSTSMCWGLLGGGCGCG